MQRKTKLMLMKRFRFFFVALAAICLIACEKKHNPEDYKVTITYIQEFPDSIGNALTFNANCSKIVRPFIWWINQELAYSVSRDNGHDLDPIADENGDYKYSLENKSIKLYFIPGKRYNVKVRYYDDEYQEYYSEITIDAPSAD